MYLFGWTIAIIVGFFGLMLGGSLLGLISLPFLQFGAQVQTNAGIIQQTYNANNALYNYHWFQERQTALTALDQTIGQSQAALTDFEQSAGPRGGWSFDDKTEDNRLRTTVLGQEAQYNSLAGEYNAHAKEVDRAIFKDGLPLFFNLKNI